MEPPERHNRELSILNTIAQALNREVDLQRALEGVLAQVADLLDLRTGWIWLLRDDTGRPYLAAAQNLPPALAGRPHRMEGSCYCLDTFRSGDLNGAANVNVITCSRLKGLVGDTGGLRYHASVPLYAQGKKLGVMNVASTDWRELTPDDLRLLYTVGDLLSIAVERARLFEHSVHFGIVEERNRLAREIHDTLAQGLAAIILQLETADAWLETAGGGDRARQAVEQALALARANIEDARRSVQDLRAAPLENSSLGEALAGLVEQLSGEATEIRAEIVGGDRPLPVRIEAGLYRIAQEALMNVLHHASASHATLQLTVTPSRARLVITDDGVGFTESAVAPGRFGLLGLRERARLLDGRAQIRSGPGRGTRIEVTVPLGRG